MHKDLLVNLTALLKSPWEKIQRLIFYSGLKEKYRKFTSFSDSSII